MAKAVLAKIADNANDMGFAWPSLKLLSAQTEISTRTIQRKIAELETRGLLVRGLNRNERGVFTGNTYQLAILPPVGSKPDDTVSYGQPHRTTPCRAVDDTVSSGGLFGGSFEPSFEPSKARAVGGVRSVGQGGAVALSTYFREQAMAGGMAVPARLVKQVAKFAGEMLAEEIEPEQIRAGIDLMLEKGLSPALLQSLVMEASNSRRRGSQTDRWLQEAQQRESEGSSG